MLRRDRTTKVYSAEIKTARYGRVHLSLRTKVHRVAMDRHSALAQLLSEGVDDVVAALRKRGGTIKIEAVARCVAEKQPFASLLPRPGAGERWPALGDAVARYVAHLAGLPNGSEKTATSAGHALARALRFFGADVRVDAIDAEQVAAFRAYLQGGGEVYAAHAAEAARAGERPPAPLAQNTVNLYLTKLGALFTFLGRQEARRARRAHAAPRPLHSPVERAEIPRLVKTRVRFLEHDEVTRLLAATPDRLKLAVMLGAFAGLRIEEVIMLRPAPLDLDLARRLILVQARAGDYAWQPKYGRDREVPFGAALGAAIDWHLGAVADGRWLLPHANPPRAAAGEPWTDRDLQRAFTRIVADAGLIPGARHPMGVTFHTLRHTFASWSIMAGVDLKTVAELMGHQTTKQVEETYSHLAPDHKRWAIQRLEARWIAPESGGRSEDTATDTVTRPVGGI